MNKTKNVIIVVLAATVIYLASYHDWDRYRSQELKYVSITLLPFIAIGADSPATESLRQALNEQLLHQLGTVDRFEVSAVQNEAPTSIKELGTTLVLEGAVHVSGSRARITAQLIDVRNETHLWAETFDLESKDWDWVSDRIARQIVAATERESVKNAT